MRKYKQKAALSLNPILDVLFLETNADQTPFPSFKNKFRIKKTASLKSFSESKPESPFKTKAKAKPRQKQEIVAGFRMSNGFGEVKRSKRSLTSEKNQCHFEEVKRKWHEDTETRERRSATVMMVRNPETQKAKRVLSNRLREVIKGKLEDKVVRKKEGLFKIVINSYRDFQ